MLPIAGWIATSCSAKRTFTCSQLLGTTNQERKTTRGHIFNLDTILPERLFRRCFEIKGNKLMSAFVFLLEMYQKIFGVREVRLKLKDKLPAWRNMRPQRNLSLGCITIPESAPGQDGTEIHKPLRWNDIRTRSYRYASQTYVNRLVLAVTELHDGHMELSGKKWSKSNVNRNNIKYFSNWIVLIHCLDPLRPQIPSWIATCCLCYAL